MSATPPSGSGDADAPYAAIGATGLKGGVVVRAVLERGAQYAARTRQRPTKSSPWCRPGLRNLSRAARSQGLSHVHRREAVTSIDALERALGAALARPGDDEYAEATQPRNATAQQRPLAVVAATNADDVTRAVRAAADTGLAVRVQGTGHGAAGVIGDDVLLIDTSRLDTISIDPAGRTARAGAGATWSALNAAAEQHGLLGLAGTAPDVGVVGYTVYGGIGWLTRPYGLASASLRRVQFVDGDGKPQVAAEDENPDALWAFRGAGGVGIATAVEIDLVAVQDLWAGYQLWPISQAEAVVTAWAAALERIGTDLTSAIGFLSAPDAPTIPEQLRGHRVVHLPAASIRGAAGFAPMQDALRAAPSPAIDTLGPCDAQRLAAIHLDPPAPVPGVGEGRWLAAESPAHALDILGAHGLGDHAPLSEIEIRHTATTTRVDPPGALTRMPGPFLLHAVGAAPSADDRPGVQQALDTVRAAAEPVDTGRSSISFLDGQTSASDALTREVSSRLDAARRRFDPNHRIRHPRTL